MKKRKCDREPGLACFTCPFRDCVRGGDWLSAWEREAYVPFARQRKNYQRKSEGRNGKGESV